MVEQYEDVCWDNDDSDAEHYEALCRLPKWQWIARDGKIVDLRRRIYTKSLPWAVNILHWMEKHHTDNTPYMCTDQYTYIEQKIYYIKEFVKRAFRWENK